MKRPWLAAALPIIAALAASPAMADEDTPGAQDSPWSGEGSISAGVTTGNTDTTDIAIALKLQLDQGDWTHKAKFSFDYAEQQSIESKNRGLLAYQLNWAMSERAFAFGRTSYERDEFSGFDSRFFLGVGLGYYLIPLEDTTWTVQAAPGLRVDDVRTVEATETEEGVEGGTEESLALTLGSVFEHKFNPAVSLSNETEIVFADVSSQAKNTFAVTAQFTDRLSGRFSYEVRYESAPPDGLESTDTASRFGIVYGF